MDAELTWGRRSVAALLLSLLTHFRSDIPRALACVFIRWLTGEGADRGNQGLRHDFEVLTNGAYARALRDLISGSELQPGIVLAIPLEFRRELVSYYAGPSALSRARSEAWESARGITRDREVVKLVRALPVRASITDVFKPSHIKMDSLLGGRG